MLGLRELSTELKEEHRAVKETVHRFAEEVMRPAGIKLDRLSDPSAVIAADSAYWHVLRKYRELGLHKGSFPATFGGLEQDALTSALISEELGWGDGGLAISLTVSVIPYVLAMLSPDPEMQELARNYCADTEGKMIGCWAITEPDHGSDWIWFEGEHALNPKCAPSVRAVKDGDDYVINGQKSAWVSNGTIATHAALFLTLDPSKGMSACGLAIVPLDLPGVSRGKPLDKMGQRALNQGEIFFDNVKIPKRMMIVEDPTLHNIVLSNLLSGCNTGMASIWAGVARSALDEAIKYAKTRVQGGRPICEHQNVKLMLFDMFVSVEAARYFARQVALHNRAATAAGGLPALQYAAAAKVLSTETAFRVASQAIQIFGGQGVASDNLVQKIFRDARASMIEDGVNEILALAGADRILSEVTV
jgi:alkylation response protein AidB-like acyl-CoA dehydrogenase